MVDNRTFAARACSGEYDGISYDTLDCQAFVEKVLSDCGCKRNWRGSNDMWRNAVHDQQPLTGDDIPVGTWVFTIKHDGGEDKKRYTDGINASHVGIYCGNGLVMHSTTGGVQRDRITSNRWTHYALANDIDYNDAPTDHDMIVAIYNVVCKEEK